MEIDTASSLDQAARVEARAVPTSRPRRLERSTAAPIVLAAVCFGGLAQLLLFGQSAGLNFVLGTAALLGLAVAIRPRDVRLDPLDLWLPLAALLFASFIALRADGPLLLFDLLADVALTGASLAALAGISVTRRAMLPLTRLGVTLVAVALLGASRLRAGIEPLADRLASPLGPSARPVARGLLLALPAVLLFSGLFAAADAVFAAYLGDLLSFSFDLGELPPRVLFALGWAWLAGGLLVFVASGREDSQPTDTVVARPPSLPLRLGAAEATTVLLAVDLVFAFFVVIQGAYLFGGRDTLETSGLTYSLYARRGFFELIAVAVLAGGLVLGLESLVASRHRVYVLAMLALLALTGVVLISATARLALYQGAYGWTELRFYALAAIVWLGGAVVAASAAVVSGASRWTMHAVVLLGLVVAGVVNAIGPQSFVAAQNVKRAIQPELVPADGQAGLDEAYLAQLGDEAVPVLVEALPRLPSAEAEQVRAILRRKARRALEDSAAGWPSWNLGRERARSALESVAGSLGR